MSDQERPVEAGGVTRITGWLAVCGGCLALAAGILVSISVLGRWLFSTPIDGDFEYVKIATAIAVFSYLPYTQARRGNIMVDTFTLRFSESTRARIDAFWDLVYAGFMGFCTYALIHGTIETFRNGETTMQRQLPLWPGIGLATMLCAILTVIAVLTARRLFVNKKA